MPPVPPQLRIGRIVTAVAGELQELCHDPAKQHLHPGSSSEKPKILHVETLDAGPSLARYWRSR